MVPALSNLDAGKLERAILAWEQYRSLPEETDSKSRFGFQKWNRGHRLRLLRCFPLERLSPEGKRHLQQEERALPDTPNFDSSVGKAEFVRSVMSAEQMAKATDDEILNLFKELTDDTQFQHPRPGKELDHIGGSIQASRAFAEFAKGAPDRVAENCFATSSPESRNAQPVRSWPKLGQKQNVPPANVDYFPSESSIHAVLARSISGLMRPDVFVKSPDARAAWTMPHAFCSKAG